MLVSVKRFNIYICMYIYIYIYKQRANKQPLLKNTTVKRRRCGEVRW